MPASSYAAAAIESRNVSAGGASAADESVVLPDGEDDAVEGEVEEKADGRAAAHLGGAEQMQRQYGVASQPLTNHERGG